ncbi:ribosomal RNA small subunit methyltransferase NEP1-like [Olea europaea var. sylvestris]|uniref:Ribosomal RNA small subunit methyltransferase NEP1-like n=1 Tax=Olea europaea subsp. europaea TaxID=158383 RepID=A0A8S0UPM0_OLEEU|nr:ribosomal RNA small subunit methyltransferase NEP1-like [Olea europaea var. sylvestris]XP_022882703.1 ribosomal RNA small subunit methyltransferase NEP1-like [Olea europaea var. sylvestris]XP_022882704.1 ribosomal RNA small subunit methyltransferase NEP1-like [Olea europaea var. sylvestris]XP_022882705.1 ribosomal RNA small subunit methyltransferase NEP1-like [Olea europaea var. sylvestris]CAA3020234.1 ribosomal RNA small subunit methyltransferase NEP1-like [Olea europaea subsp. europaea]
MVRPYKMKGQKRKKKEKYDREEESEQLDDNDMPESPKKAKTEVSELEKEKSEEVVDEMPGIPIVPADTGKKPGVIFILEKASLEIGKVGKSYQLLSSDEHANYLMKNKRNPAEYRPDIAFQAIQTILDSRVNKSGRLKALYVRTQQGILFQIKPHARMPRTYKRFSGLMVQLLQKLHITAAGKGEKLLRVIKNPVTQYLPINSRKIGFSHSSEKLVDMYDYVGTLERDMDLVFVVGAMAHGKIDKDYVEDYLSISEFPMSAAYCISIITTAVERKWKIL